MQEQQVSNEEEVLGFYESKKIEKYEIKTVYQG